MKDNLVIREEHISVLSNTFDIISKSLTDLSRVSRNMIPETLYMQGLNKAIENFCILQNERNIYIKYNFVGTHKRLNLGFELIIYRMFQELTNNSIKHSLAANIKVCLFQEPETLRLTIADNGTGLDTSNTSTTEEKGIANIPSQVASLNGLIIIRSTIGQGTETIIEFTKPQNIIVND